MLDVNQIREIIPHRYPMLLVDRIDEMGPDWAVGVKNVSFNEPFFQGHFPDFPVMPGVLVVESMAQVGAVFLLNSEPDRRERLKDKIVLFASIEQARFRKPVFPGDQLRIEVRVLKRKASVCKVAGRASVNGRLVAEATLMCQVADKAALSPSSQAQAAPPAGVPSGS